MTVLSEMIEQAAENKPAMGDECNHCGWCCMTEVCQIGQLVTRTSMIPCSLLIERNGKYFCKLADSPERKRLLGIGTGCCAITIEEQLAALLRGELPANLKED